MRKYGLVLAVLMVLGCLLFSTAGAADPLASAWNYGGPLTYEPTTTYSQLYWFAETKIALIGSGPFLDDSVRVFRNDPYYDLPLMCSPWKGLPQVVEYIGPGMIEGARLYLPGGQCMDPGVQGAPDIDDWLMIEIKHEGTWYPVANGLTKAGVTSDVVNDSGRKPYQQGYVAPSLTSVSLADAGYLSPQIKAGSADFCADLDGNGEVDLADAVGHAAAIRAGWTCSAQ